MLNALSLVLLLLAFSSLSTITPPMAPAQQLSVSINIENYESYMIVYPDGAVKPVAKLNASIRIMSGKPLNLSGTIVFNSTTDYESRYLARQASLYMNLPLSKILASSHIPVEQKMEKVKLRVELEGSVEGGKTTGTKLDVNGTIFFANETYNNTIVVEKVEMVLSKGILTLLVQLRSEKPITEAAVKENITKIIEELKKLEEAGIDFIKLESFSIGVEEGKPTLKLKLRVDLGKAVNYALSKGLPPDDAERARRVLLTTYNVTGGFNLKLVLDAFKNILLDMSYSDEYKGQVEEANNLVTLNSDALAKFFLVLVFGISEDIQRIEHATATPSPMGSPAALISVLPIEQPKLVAKPPSKDYTYVRVLLKGDTIHLSVLSNSSRVIRYPPTNDPSRDAERTLSEYANQFAKASQMLKQFKAMLTFMGIEVKGLERLLPSRIVLVPASPGVKLSKNTAAPRELDTVIVEIGKPTATSRTTTTTTKTMEATTTATTLTAIKTKTTPTTTKTTSPPPPPTTPTTPTTTTTSTPQATATASPTASTAKTTTGPQTSRTLTATAAYASPVYLATIAAIIVVIIVAALALLRRR